jgi:ABC-type sugar transport system ATPase subunit
MPLTPLLSIRNVSKRFGQVQALKSVSLEFEPGRIYGLAGENGAGKSTLVNLLCGRVREFEGTIEWEGTYYAPNNPGEAEETGISVFHQEIPICPNLSVAANVFLGRALSGRFFPDWSELERRCRELFEDLLGISIDPGRLMRECTVVERQLALLVRALSQKARCIILDEPTTALTPPEVAKLFAIIRRLAAQGITFLFVSHLLDELIQLTEEIYVLRDGVLVGHLARDGFDAELLARLIAGRALGQSNAPAPPRFSSPKLEIRALTTRGQFEDVSFQVARGEIVGLTGLRGSGRSAVARALFGAPPADSGEVLLNGKRLVLRCPHQAIKAGLGYVPEDRKELGLFESLDIGTNLGMARLPSLSRLGLLPRQALHTLTGEMQRKVQIKLSTPADPIHTLSGGNQQKVLIARWLAINPQVLVMNEPTRGVDVGAKDEIGRLIQSLAAEGGSFLIASSDFDELIQLADRILVMNAGRLVAEFTRQNVRKHKLIQATGAARPDQPLSI